MSDFGTDPKTPFLPGDTATFRYSYAVPANPSTASPLIWTQLAAASAGVQIVNLQATDHDLTVTFRILWGIWKIGTVATLFGPGVRLDGEDPTLQSVSLDSRTWGGAGGAATVPDTSGPPILAYTWDYWKEALTGKKPDEPLFGNPVSFAAGAVVALLVVGLLVYFARRA